MAYNRRSGGGGYGGYNGGGGGRYNGGGYRSGSSNSVSPWQSNSGNGGPSPRQSQQGGTTPALAMASNIISKLLTSSTSMAGSGFNGGPNRNGNWNNGGSRMSHMSMHQRHNGSGGYSKDNRRRGGDSHNKFSGGRKSGGTKDAEKRKSTGKVNDENKKGPNERERTKEQLDLEKKASYVGVPSAVLYCHVCSKHMWDSESFEKHVRGRPHELMMTYLDEAYRMRVDFMRHQIKAVENQREIDLERVTNNKHKAKANSGKSSGNNASSKPLLRSYCPMCDVRFYGPLTGHRKSDRHRKLKQFLHPECKLCDALFHTRLEMDEHKLTAGHLKKVAEHRNIENPHLKDDEFDLIDMIKIEEDDQDHDQFPVAKKYEMLTDRDATKLKLELEGGSSEKHREKKNRSAIQSDSALKIDDKTMEVDEEKDGEQYEEKDGEQYDEEKDDEQYEEKDGEQYEEKDGEQYEEKDGEQYEEKDGEKVDEDIETSGVVTTSEEPTGDDDKADQSIKEESTINVDSTISKDNQTTYDPDVAIGQDLLLPFKGFVCRLCNCFLLDEPRVLIHCQTASHYINYTTMTKMREATSGGKKRGIDQVIGTDETNIKTEQDEDTVDESEFESLLEDVSQLAASDSEEQPTKRIKLDEGNDETKEENNEIDISEQSIQKVEPMVVESADNVVKPVEDVQPVPVVADADPLPVVAAAGPVPVAADPVPVVTAADPVPVVTAQPITTAQAVVTTPTRGRGGGRGRGHRGGSGGVARRGNRR